MYTTARKLRRNAQKEEIKKLEKEMKKMPQPTFQPQNNQMYN